MTTDTGRVSVQLALIIAPVALFIFTKKAVKARAPRIGIAFLVAALAGAVAYYLAAQYGWKPLARGSKIVEFSPAGLFGVHFAALFITLTVLALAKPRDVRQAKG
jgi:hypothetical protein